MFSEYIYFFALPTLFIVNLAETIFSTETLSFIFAGIIPIFVVVAVYSQLFVLFKFSRNTFYLPTLSTIFGNLTFFSIPFVTFAFPVDHLQRVATLAVFTIGIVAIALSIALLEFYRLGESPKREGLRQVAKGLAKNPLIVSIVAGILISVVGAEIPSLLSTFFHMVGVQHLQ